jgi:hypothetical protein
MKSGRSSHDGIASRKTEKRTVHVHIVGLILSEQLSANSHLQANMSGSYIISCLARHSVGHTYIAGVVEFFHCLIDI